MKRHTSEVVALITEPDIIVRGYDELLCKTANLSYSKENTQL